MGYHYDTVSAAVEALRLKGYTVDFRLEESRLVLVDSSTKEVILVANPSEAY